MFGHSREQVIGKNDYDFFPKEQAEFFWEKDRETLDSGVVIDIPEEPILTKNMGTRILHTRKVPLYGKHRRPHSLLAISEDITERKEAEEALRESEERHSGLFEHAPLMYVITRNEEGVPFVSDCNELFLISVGYKREEVVGQPLANFYSPESRSELLEGGGYARALAGEFFIGERELLTRDGRLIPTLLYTATELDSAGQVIGTRAMFVDITERKQAEEALHTSEQMLRGMLSASPVGIVVTRNKEIQWANNAFVEIFGFTDEQQYLDQPTNIMHPSPESYERVRGVLYDNLQPGHVSESDAILKRKDGSLFDAHIRINFVDISDPSSGTISAISDISDRKKSEESLRESEERLELALWGADLGLWDWYSLMDQAVVNQRAAEIVGYSLDEIEQIFGFWESLLHPDDRQRALEKVFNHLAGLTDYYEDEYRVRHKSGDWKWILSRGKVTERDPDGKPLRMTGTYLDITERKRAEEALRFEREQLLSLFESINEIILVIDPTSYEILFANKFTEDLYGKKLIGGFCYEKLAGLESPCGHCSNEKIVKLQGEPYQWEYSNPILKRDFLATDRMIRWPDGRHVKFQIATDITERKEAQEEQDLLKAQLFQAQKMESIGTLAGGIAHDFNNLLTVVLGFSEMLLIGKDKGDPSYDDLQKIRQAARSGADLVKRILMFSRKADLNPRPLDLNREVEQAKQLLTRTIPKMIEIELLLSDGLATVNADPTQVEQVLMNLAVNARDAMPDGGKLTIETKNVALDGQYCRMHLGATPGDYVLLSVSDTGHGMDKETLNHIFEPFYTTKGVGRGTGLGLATVYGIVKQHGGYIDCYSAPGMGTSFKIYLPVAKTETASDMATSGEMPAFGTETILLVDDEEFVRDLGKRILERSGYTVLTAANGKEALGLYRREKGKISLVILDLIMPEMEGKQCLEELLKIDPKPRVLIASGFAANGQTKEAIEIGAKGFVGKPYNMKGMLRAVREALDQS
ncbi:MAG: PAS domain S-box protein [Desulfomonilaceae bacterium]